VKDRLYPDLDDVRAIPFAKRVIREYIADNMPLYAAALSFHGLLALFPFLIFLLALLGFLRIPGIFDWMLEQAALALPPEAFAVVNDALAQVQEGSQPGLISFGAITAFAVASTAVRALMNAMNTAYGMPETRAFWKKFLQSFAYTFGLALLLIIAGGALVLGPQSAEWVAGRFGLGSAVVAAWTWLRYPVIVLMLMLVAAIIYHIVPNVAQPVRFITPGAIIAVVAWVVATLGFSIYVTMFGNYNAIYGSIGGIVVLLMYFFISASVLLLGAEINAEVYHLKRGRPVPDDTSGI
jgi:membrane protein